jgi:2-hydroxy-3-keto-5-methylthiopentenyl-1-phosphate phosphatase
MREKETRLTNPKSPIMNVFCDFDGTVTLEDGTDAILQRFALPVWREWEQLWAHGEISSLECLSQQVQLIRADRKTLVDFATGLAVDPGVVTLAHECQEREIPFTIVSDGLDLVVKTVLDRHNLSHIPFFANHVIWPSSGSPALEFPHAAPACDSRAGTCKCAITGVGRKRGVQSVYIGDGRSDFCVAAKMDCVYAKGALQKWCVSHDIPCQPFETLAEVTEHLFPDEILAR